MRKVLFILTIVLIPFPAAALDFTAHGYYRNRAVFYHDLDTQQPNKNIAQPGLGSKPCRENTALVDQPGDNDCFGSILFNQQRLRVEPMLKVNDNISLHTQMDILDNVIFGTQEVDKLDFVSPIVGTVQLPGSGGALGVVGGEAGENKTIHFRRAWANILTPAGAFRIGRQPSHWGMGIFQNDGNDPYDDFGDSADRILYVASMDTQKLGTFTFGTSADLSFSTQQDPRIYGLGGAVQGLTQDMRQFGGFVLYEKEEELFKVTLGSLSGVRVRNGTEEATTTTARSILDDNGDGVPDTDAKGNSQLTDPLPAGRDGNTIIYFFDLYGKLEIQEYYKFQLEYVFMKGDIATGLAIDAVPFNALPSNALGPYVFPRADLPPQNQLQVHMVAFEGKADYDFGTFKLQSGFASGDPEPLSSTITQFGFRPDYKVAFLMFRVPLGRSPAISQANGNGNGSRVLVGGVPVTGNFVNNAVYGGLGYEHKLNVKSFMPMAEEVKVGIKFVTAWAHESNFNIDFSEITGIDGLPKITNPNLWYGMEVDGSLEGRFYDHLLIRLEGGVLIPGGAYDVSVDTAQFDPGNLSQVNSIPYDAANIAYGTQLSVAVEF